MMGSTSEPCLFVAISSHGFGHLAQSAPVVNALRETLPSLRVVVQSTHPRALLASQLRGEFEQICQPTDIGMLMSGSLDVAAQESAAEYLRFHREWERRVERQSRLLQRYRPDAVLANVPYLLPAAADRAGIPCVSLCSLNWLDIYDSYCGNHPEADRIRQQMLEAYRAATLFLQPRPSMPMVTLPNRREIGPIARRGRSWRALLNRELDLEKGEKLVLISLGGIHTPLPLGQWPAMPGVRFLVPGGDVPDCRHILSAASLELSHIDLLCSCDALITKPGYGSFAEAACNQIPVLYVPRDGWPEAPFLISWLQKAVACCEISRSMLEQGAFEVQLRRLFAEKPRTPMEPTGIADATEALLPLLQRN